VASCLSEDEEDESDDDGADEAAFTPPLGEARTSFVERRRALLDLCTREEWNLSKVARVLRRSRVFVYRMLREHNIERPGGKRHCFGR
jgi:transcriptional regulator of acetoin/glycerol metabolism